MQILFLEDNGQGNNKCNKSLNSTRSIKQTMKIEDTKQAIIGVISACISRNDLPLIHVIKFSPLNSRCTCSLAK